MVSYLACVKTHVEAHETIWNYGLVYSIEREKNFAARIRLEYNYSNQMFISDSK